MDTLQQLNRELIDCAGIRVSITSEDPSTIAHFAHGENYADVIVNQFNNERFYDEYLKGKKDLVVLDLGANIGLFSIYAAPCAKVILAVEPFPGHLHILKDLTRNYKNVVPVQAAIYHSNGTVHLSTHAGNTTMNSVVNNYGNSYPVPAKTLQTIMEENNVGHIDFVKCDIEGGEMALFNDAIISYAKGKVHEWYIEVHPTGTDMEFNIKYIMDLFKSHGWSARRLRWDAIHCVEVV